MKGLLTYTAVVVILLIITVFLIIKMLESRRKKELDAIIRSIERTGKVMYNRMVYVVQEVCESGYFGDKANKDTKYLIISRIGDNKQIFKLPIHRVQPYICHTSNNKPTFHP